MLFKPGSKHPSSLNQGCIYYMSGNLRHKFHFYYVGTPTCHFISYSIPFRLTALLPLSVHQSTHRPSKQHLNHHRKPLSHSLLLCLLPNKENSPWEAELPAGSHAHQLCQPANGRAGWPARDLYKRSPSDQRQVVQSEGVNCQWQNRKEALQDSIKMVWSTPGCPVTTPRELGLPLQQWAAIDHQLHWPLSAEVHRGLPFEPSRASSGHRYPRLTGRFSAIPHHRDIYRADQLLTNRQVFRTASPAADPSYSTTIKSSPDCTTNSWHQ